MSASDVDMMSDDELCSLAEMAYGDGDHIERGDTVYIPGEPGLATYRVIGLDPIRWRVLVLDARRRQHLLPPAALARERGRRDEHR